MHAQSFVWPSLGRILFGLGIAAFGVQNFLYADGVFGLEPVPGWVPTKAAWAYLTGFLLLVSGTVVIAGTYARQAATVIGTVLGMWVLALQVPKLLLSPRSGGAWTTTFETLALCGAAWVIAGGLPQRTALSNSDPSAGIASSAQYGRIAYALSLPVFGVLHFVYRDYVASVIPTWIPNPDAWALVTGVAFMLAGLSMLTGLYGRLAAMMVGTMFAIWVVILHAPRVMAASDGRSEWTSLIIALAMSGGAWIILAVSENLVVRRAPVRKVLPSR